MAGKKHWSDYVECADLHAVSGKQRRNFVPEAGALIAAPRAETHTDINSSGCALNKDLHRIRIYLAAPVGQRAAYCSRRRIASGPTGVSGTGGQGSGE
ncbi:hypothetical protein [Hyphomonas sp.]|uniref:hypothetical protein n=1 Tax=Hyphomonas sp. TaxID=87 RepID=UPI0025C61275|nr:hypothetical protein [Hyphomonas sp.]